MTWFLSINYFLGSVLVPPFGLLLESPQFTTPYALLISNIILLVAHLALYTRIMGVTLPLSLLGIADALFGAALWAGLARVILHTTGPKSSPNLESREHLLSDIPEGDRGGVSNINAVSDIKGEDLQAIGFGIAFAVLNLSTAVIPVPLSIIENAAGYPGLEAAFVVLAGSGCLACVALTRSYRSLNE